jgi:putative acetyltransferase
MWVRGLRTIRAMSLASSALIDVQIEAFDPLHPDSVPLLQEAAAEARALYPKLFAEHLPPPSNPPLRAREVYVVARRAGNVVGCGALKRIDDTTAELHRMLVTAPLRRQGVGRALVKELEQQAVRLGYQTLLLETGRRQRAAMALYAACGWKRTQAFGPYVGDGESVCYGKNLRKAAAASATKSSTASKPMQNRTSCPA